MLEVAFFGLGVWGRLLKDKLRDNNKTIPMYFCDIDKRKKSLLKGQNHIQNFTTDYRKIKNPDVAIVATYPQSHPEIAEYSLEEGADVFVEKPAACSVEEIDNLRKTAENQGRKIAVGFQENYNNPHIKSILGNREIIEVVDHRNIKDPHLSNRLAGCHLVDDVPFIHNIESLNYLYGIKTDSIRTLWLSENSLASEFECENGVRGKEICNWVDDKTDRYVEFKTPEGNIYVELGMNLKVTDISKSYEIPIGDKVGMLINDFIDSINNNREPRTSLQDENVFKTHVDTLKIIGRC